MLPTPHTGFTTCSVDGTGGLSSCGNTSLGSRSPEATGVDVNCGGRVYVSAWTMFGASDVYLCPISGLTVLQGAASLSPTAVIA